MPGQRRQRTIARGRSDYLPARFLLRVCVLFVLHVLYGSLFLLEHLVRRPWRSGFSYLRSTSGDLQRDAQRWSKLPRHVAVAFAPTGSLASSRKGVGRSSRRLKSISQDVSKLAEWCLQLGVERLSIYDAPGHARCSATLLCEQLSPSLSLLIPPTTKTGPESPVPTFVVASAAKAKTPTTLRISLLSEQDGKQHVALVARSLSDAVAAGYLKSSDIQVDLLQEKMQSSLTTEPELLIVLGGPSLRLQGFPPWHVRLTEVYHEPSLALLGSARLSYRTFRRALDAYAASEQRRGK